MIIKPLKALLLVMLLTAVNLSSAQAAGMCSQVLLESAPSRFETDILDSMSAAKMLRLKASDILEVSSRVHSGGAYASGILKVRTAQGVFVLKVFSEGYIVRELAPSIVIQNALAERGLAPAVRGILSSKEMQELLVKFPQTQKLLQDPDISFAVLMDPLDVVSHVTAGHVDHIPAHWTKEKLVARIAEMEKAFADLRLAIPEDLQLVFDRRGGLFLLDFDTYAHMGKDGRAYGQFSSDGTMSGPEYLKSVMTERNQTGQFRLKSDGSVQVHFKQLRQRLGLN
ncbi:MAG: hypothetical protein HUU57_07770 [Bdellovibrio sp.]|nr:hypothetical protein [Bdellovibrio sp.]